MTIGEAVRKTIFPFILLAASACAVQKPPTGGPEDRTPPQLVSSVPARDSTGVGRETGVRLFFSERIDGESFKSRIRSYPPLEFESVRADDDQLEIRFREALPETTIVLAVSGGYLDYHGVRSKQPILLRFATVDSMARGRIEGRIRFKGIPDSTGVARLFVVRPDTTIDVVRDREDLVAFADWQGRYRFDGLPADSSRYLVQAFLDADGDGKPSGEKEFAQFPADTLLLTAKFPIVPHFVFDIIDPNEPGGVEGRIIDETGLGRLPIVVLRAVTPETGPIVALVDTTGAFVLPRIPPGGYLFTVLVDMRPDSLCGDYPSPADSSILLPEPCFTAPETLFVMPGETVSLDPVTLGPGGAR